MKKILLEIFNDLMKNNPKFFLFSPEEVVVLKEMYFFSNQK